MRFGGAGGLALLLLAGAALTTPSGSLAGVPTAITMASAATASSIAYYVSPKGSDSNSGKSSSQPLRLIQTALKRVRPGDTIKLAAGAYHERLTTLTAGTPGHPITIKGPETGKDRSGRYKAVLFGTSRLVSVNHSYYVFDGFTIDGQERLSTTAYPMSLSGVRAFKDSVQTKVVDGRLIYIGAADTTRNLTGIIIRNMFLNGAGGECVRMRNAANHNEVANSVIQWCGLYGSGDDLSEYKYHNGEGVYLGTSPSSTDQPMFASDTTNNNYIHDNTINTFGSECLDVKENSYGNRFQNNDCGYNDEPLSFNGSNIELRGSNNVIVGSRVTQSRGFGLKLWSDAGPYPQGGNSLQGTSFSAVTGVSITNKQTASQGTFCGNTFDTSRTLAGVPAGVLGLTAPCA
jgi:hypothetical protein